ncbi:helix-turn-helix domain-containing protein [Ferruginibacter paludis]|uniref:helix-turn-helix domain-containing protein n=1 Tax=Ferruginibacter paludis TaxID=1310417 RepID=UPI0025B384A6|nr:helix-turn-helix domain-containing protein [Ferruginibacter paludis]MDN3654162.1 helix-turn-helix domain-containing protein [Ferruginibacter paludis]
MSSFALFRQTIKIREEVAKEQKQQPTQTSIRETTGFTEKPLFKIQEICSLFKVTKPTIYDWIKHGKLKKVKIRSRVYFLGRDIRELMKA